MSTIDDIIAANAAYAQDFAGPQGAEPARHVAVLTCMDARLDPLAAFGLELGAAHVIRNAGGMATDDALRSLAISQRALGTREVAVVHHTRCGMQGFDDEQFRADLERESGARPTWDVPGFTDVEADTARAVRTIRACEWLPHRDAVRGFVYDVTSGRLTEVD
jgi:carbonic anhydrase